MESLSSFLADAEQAVAEIVAQKVLRLRGRHDWHTLARTNRERSLVNRDNLRQQVDALCTVDFARFLDGPVIFLGVTTGG